MKSFKFGEKKKNPYDDILWSYYIVEKSTCWKHAYYIVHILNFTFYHYVPIFS